MMKSFSGSIPRLVLAERVIHKMVSAARLYTEDETGEAMVGVVVPGTEPGSPPTLYVLDTIPPDDTDVVREHYTFQQGDERQYEIFTWLNENWQVYRARARQGDAAARQWDVPLIHLGDWHKQPGYMIAPSHGDLLSALEQISEQKASGEHDFLLVPILTRGHPSTTGGGNGVNYYCVPDEDDTYARIDFWYISAHLRMFVPISPEVRPDDQLPPSAPLHWHIRDEARASLEIGQLEYDGYLVSPPIAWDTDGLLPLEVCMIAARSGERQMWIIATPYNFPAQPPRLYRSPLVKMTGDDDWYDVFEGAWANAQPVPEPDGWAWSDEHYLVDYLNTVADAQPKAGVDDQTPTTTGGNPA